MKKAWPVFCALVLGSTMLQAKEASKAANFSGEWVLDFGQTKNPPAGLEAYSMVVNQDQQQLKVETSLKGDLQASQDASNSGYPGGSRGGRRGGGMGGGMGMPGGGGMGMPRGGIGMPRSGGGMPNDSGMPGGSSGGGGSGSPHSSSSRGSVAAYKLYPSSAVYKLDGSESTMQLGDADQTSATAKTEWGKNGEELKLSLAGDENPEGKGGKVQIKEQWKLSADGQSLMLERSVKAPEGSGTVHLVFSKK
jgi:hypothetical protein